MKVGVRVGVCVGVEVDVAGTVTVRVAVSAGVPVGVGVKASWVTVSTRLLLVKVAEKATPLLCVKPLYVAKSPVRLAKVRTVKVEFRVGLKSSSSEIFSVPPSATAPLTAS